MTDTKERYGIAFDIGTTTLVGMLWELSGGKRLGALALTNPQTRFGSDVITRIQYIMKKPENIKVLTDDIRGCLSKMTQQMCESCGIKSKQISEAAVAGNTTMSHIFLGKDPASLAKAPFAPAYMGAQIISGKESQLLINDEADVYVFPNIAGHVGGDMTAGILSSGFIRERGLSLLVDIGTNGELALTDGERVLACSTAAGPAFEGAGITHGMRAARGAIEKMMIKEGQIILKTIEDAPPIGICGSGLIDIMAEMVEADMINRSGKLFVREFVLAKTPDRTITINQADVREVQMAKGAISGGIKILLGQLGKTVSDLDRIGIAGAFGSCIDKKNAVRIGILPQIDEKKIVSLGNAAGEGVSLALCSRSARQEAERIAKVTEHVDLASHPDFQREYMKGMGFPGREF